MSKVNGDFRWSDSIDLKQYFSDIIAANDKNYSQRFESADRAVSAALAAADRAVAKAEAASEKRFESVNEFRNTLADQQRTLMPRAEIEVLLKAIGDRVDGLSTRLEKTEGTQVGTRNTLGYVVGIGGIMIAVVSVILRIFGK